MGGFFEMGYLKPAPEVSSQQVLIRGNGVQLTKQGLGSQI